MCALDRHEAQEGFKPDMGSDQRGLDLFGVDTRTGNPVALPISEPLRRLFKRLRGSNRQSSDVVGMDGKTVKPYKPKGHVFLFKGQPIKNVNVALKAACERAGIPYGRNTPNGITFHDLRPTLAPCCNRHKEIFESRSS